MTVRFAHIRYQNEDGTPRTKGGMTIGYVIHANGCITAAKAYCNNLDNYNKSIGRAIVSGRIKAGKCATFVYDGEVKNIIDFLLDTNWPDPVN